MTVATLAKPARKASPQTHERFYKRIDGFSYEIGGGSMGLDAEFSGELEIDEQRMAIWVPYADGNRRDGVGDILEIGGIDLSRHRLNPVHMFDHGVQVSLPIGLVEDPDTHEYTSVIDLDNRTAKDQVFFYRGKGMAGVDKVREYDHALFCEQLFDMLCKRLIRGGSIGYRIINADRIEADYRTGAPRGLHLFKVLKLESSSVVMPANPETVRKVLSMPTVCGKRLSPYLVKSLVPYDPGRKAQLGYEPRYKALPDIRQKYRGAKGRVRRVRRSSPGSSIVHVHGKDLDAVRQAAEAKSVKFEHAGTAGQMHKVRLTGDDGAIDGIAQQYGRKVKSMETKSMAFDVWYHGTSGEWRLHNDGQGLSESGARVLIQRLNNDGYGAEMHPSGKRPANKYAPGFEILHSNRGKSMNSTPDGNKGAPEKKEDETQAKHDEPDGDEGEEPLEPYGAQVLRRIHEDHSILMEEYDEMIQVLEQDGVKDHLQEVLEHAEEVLTKTEELFTKTYEDLPEIEGAGEKGDGPETEATEATSGEEDLPTPDEAVEGMRKKYIKGLRVLYKRMGRKGLPIEDGHEPGKEAAHERGHKSRQLGVEGEHEPGKEGVRQERSSDPVVSVSSREKVDTAAAMKSETMGVEDGHEPGREAMHEEGRSDPVIDPRHRETLDTAAGFVKDLAQTQELSDQHRFDAYHYHKLLDPIGDELTAKFKSQYPEADTQDAAVNVTEPTGQRNVRTGDTAQAKGMDPVSAQDAAVNVTEGKGWHVAIKGAAGFLREVATAQAYGDEHRAKAMEYGKMLDGVIQHGFPQMEGQDANVNVTAPEGDVSVKSLREALARRSEEITKLRGLLESIKV